MESFTVLDLIFSETSSGMWEVILPSGAFTGFVLKDIPDGPGEEADAQGRGRGRGDHQSVGR